MAYVAYAAQIDVRFGDPVSEVLDSNIGVCPGNFARESPHLFGPGWVGIDGEAQTVAKMVSRHSRAALRGLRAGASACILAVSPDLAVARQAASFRLSWRRSITLNSASSTSCTPRCSAPPRTALRRSISRRLALRRLSAMLAKRSIRSI